MTRSEAPEERYAAVVEELCRHDGVTGPDAPGERSRFGSSGLKVGGRLFAMLAGGRLVVKLPRPRVDSLVAAGVGERFDPRRDGCRMKEWLAVDPAADEPWLDLATEALRFVAPNG